MLDVARRLRRPSLLLRSDGMTEVYSAGTPAKKMAENSLDEMERTYGVAVVDNGFVLRSGRRVVRVKAS